MRFGSLQQSRRILERSAALIIVGGLTAGCSSGVSRFTDGMFTGSTQNQKSIISADNQPFPGDVARAAPVDGTHTGSLARAAVEPQPVTRSSLPPVQSAPAKPAPVPAHASAPALDRAPTGSVAVAPAAPQVADDVQQGWSRAGGTQVSLKEGETLYNLSKRFGVPVNAIMKANGIADAGAVSVGQKIVIPTYVYSAKAPVSAPDNSKQVADAKSSRGAKSDLPVQDVPRPAQKPDNVAVLPQQPKVKEPEAPAQTADNSVAPKSVAPKGGYTVVSGDSLYGIAKKTGVKAADIRKANGLGESAALKIGQNLVIPAVGQVAQAPQSVDPVITGSAGPAKKADKPASGAQLATYTPPKRSDKQIKEAEAASDATAPVSTGIGKMRWPVRGRVVGTYGNSSGSSVNDGIDIAVPEGTPVKAAENGVVIFAGDGLKDFGKTVLVRHADGKVTVYGHTSELKVSRGDTVKRGQEIARSGMTGKTDTPKLHFEVREDSNPVDPQQYLE